MVMVLLSGLARLTMHTRQADCTDLSGPTPREAAAAAASTASTASTSTSTAAASGSAPRASATCVSMSCMMAWNWGGSGGAGVSSCACGASVEEAVSEEVARRARVDASCLCATRKPSCQTPPEWFTSLDFNPRVTPQYPLLLYTR